MFKLSNNISFICVAGLLFGLISVQVYFSQSLGQSTQPTNMTNSNQSFFSKKDLFTFSKPQGYGSYEERNSNVFQPGETIYLYIEPSGFEYKTLQDDSGNVLYSIAFSPTATIYDKNGNLLAGPLEIPNTEIISHYKNKEIFIPFTITQSSPFPPGDYMIKYTITDINSGNSFNIVKNLTISNQNDSLTNNSAVNNTKV
jgi:hypothetical protein